MIVEYIRYAIPEDQAGPFEDAYANAGAPLEASPHCEHYEVARCAEDPIAYAVRIEWDSAVGHQQGFRGGPEFRNFIAAVRPYVDMIEEMRHYEIKVASPKQSSDAR